MLSKSKFVKGMQCSKLLWLDKHRKEALQTSPAFLKKAQSGQEVGQLARDLFPGGKEIAYNPDDMAGMAVRTKELINQGVKIIYEATFEYQGILVMVDILEIEGDRVVLNEVKSSTNIYRDSKAQHPKEEYLWDLGVQYYVLAGLGYKVEGAYLICLDKTYMREGALDLKGLFLKNDFLEFVKDFQSTISKHLADMNQVLASQQEPDVMIGKHCSAPHECSAKPYCWEEQQGLVGHEHIFALARHGFSNKIMKLYQDRKIFFKDLEEEDIQSLTRSQRMQVEHTKTNTPHIEKDAIQEFLATLKYPLYHLDFETYQPAIPPFDGVRPYMQIPFQYSIHIEHEDGRIEHKEFLAECGTDGRLELAQRLVKDIPSDACVLAYSSGFEQSILKGLADLFATNAGFAIDKLQDLVDFSNKQLPQIVKVLLQIRSNIIDLMTPFQHGDYYDPKMGGSYSIKSVLPALVPDFEKAYKDLELVHNGEEAMRAYTQMPNMSKEEQEKTKKALLEYCKLDTLAMVEVLGVLKRAVE
ncbi:hypothetical protein HBZC1_10030 [Helicobacter bizzozeronii CIII-1]|uniref:DUF2779 domain-containing protein n=1 Tax=Helicobacter bizzozeronii (strain CIII-1) TaxID=1002804 RepID=F8KQ78_HELBC|nr:DUF2779 domain-containing protein [Helicobacter bizzozeronii]CCB79989.1 hypothetical protein HBZC1_10030 [Helicobacter bizzozeronii CIII-1]